MARTVTDAAILLGVLEGAGPDANDPATTRCRDATAAGAQPGGVKTAPHDYTVYLDKAGLKGARIGIPRAFYYDKVTPPGSDHPEGGLNDAQAKVMAEAIEILRKQGAIIVDPADIPSVVDKDRDNNLLAA